ncbi:EamA family transporter [Streptomyces sp. NPDC049954]|uniref:EamA family transporter n=1 Tax=Streptomyces sp. NPDC049954 TaxID=3155779 RepID=UPI0034480B35
MSTREPTGTSTGESADVSARKSAESAESADRSAVGTGGTRDRLVRVAPLLVLLQICSLQAGSAVAKTTYDRLDPTAMAGLRLGFAALVTAAVVRPAVHRLSARQWGAAGALGLVFAANNLTFFQAIGRLPLGVASTVELLGPLLLAVALSRRPAHLAAGLLALAGVLLLGAPGGHVPVAGLGFGLAAAVCRGAYVGLSKRVGRLFPDFTGLSVALLVGAVVLVPVAALADGGAVVRQPGLLLPGLAVALLSSLVPYALDMTVLRRIDSRAFGVLLGLGPAVGVAIGFLALHEPLSAREAVAVALVVAAALWSFGGGRDR